MAQASPPADWIEAPGASAELVPESVFGGRVALYRAGPPSATEAVVLVHGMGKAAARDWAHVIPALAKRYAVYAVDLPGFGYSDKGNHHYSPDNMARALETVLAPRIAGRFTLIGHSMGGTVALAYAATYPSRVRRLVLVDVAGVLHRSVYAEFLGRVAAQRALGLDSPWYESVVRAIQLRAENWPVRGELVLERAGVRQRVLRGDPNAITAFALVEHDFSGSLRTIAAPTLIVWGAEDTIAPLRTGQALAAAIPRARLTVIEGAGHAPQVQFPDRFNPLLIDELDGRQFAAQSYALRAEPIQGERIGRCEGQRGQDVRDGVDAKNTRLEFTASIISGSLILDASSVDAAGTTFVQAPAIATNEGEEAVVLRFSISAVSRPGDSPLALHDIVRLAPGETLTR